MARSTAAASARAISGVGGAEGVKQRVERFDVVECRFGHFHCGHLFGPDRLRQRDGVHLPQFSAACHGRSSWCCSSLNRA
jgi:hypothetical protein